jgi:hypothetical protein
MKSITPPQAPPTSFPGIGNGGVPFALNSPLERACRNHNNQRVFTGINTNDSLTFILQMFCNFRHLLPFDAVPARATDCAEI